MNRKIIFPVISGLIIILAYFANSNFRFLISKDVSESVFWVSIPIFIFSIITLFIKNDVFNSWFRFSTYAYLLGIILSILSFSSVREFAPSVQEIFVYAYLILYSLISIILIIYKSIKKN